MMDNFLKYTDMVQSALATVSPLDLNAVQQELLRIMRRRGKIFVCGNGGSAAIAEHLSCDHSKGICTDTALRPHVIPLASNVSLLTAIANDINYESVFSKQIEWFATSMDALVVISSSGNSPNIVNALTTATERQIPTIAFVGFDGGRAKSLANLSVHVKADNYGVVEDCHQILMHFLAQSIRTTYALDMRTVKL